MWSGIMMKFALSFLFELELPFVCLDISSLAMVGSLLNKTSGTDCSSGCQINLVISVTGKFSEDCLRLLFIGLGGRATT